MVQFVVVVCFLGHTRGDAQSLLWLCAPESLLVVSRAPCGVLGVESGLALHPRQVSYSLYCLGPMNASISGKKKDQHLQKYLKTPVI